MTGKVLSIRIPHPGSLSDLGVTSATALLKSKSKLVRNITYSWSVTLPYDCHGKLIVNSFRLFSARNGSFMYLQEVRVSGMH